MREKVLAIPPILKPTRGSAQNLLRVYDQSRDWERRAGKEYYARQLQRIGTLAQVNDFRVPAAVGAFAALSPNNSENMNYRALETCMRIVSGELPADTKVISYTNGKNKALRCLRNEPPENVLGGLKVRAFYRNTMNDWDDTHLTVDGHMLGAWIGTRLNLKRDAQIKTPTEYRLIETDLRNCANFIGIHGTHFQATIWLTWKRLHRILYNPQMSFSWDND